LPLREPDIVAIDRLPSSSERIRETERRPMLKTTNAASFANTPVPPREWDAEDLVPKKQVTILGGDGATGKTTLALQYAVAKAVGGEWLGRMIPQGRCLFITAEDDEQEIHRRLHDICEELRIDIEALGDLDVRSLAGDEGGALLAELDGPRGALKPTALYEQTTEYITARKPALVILDPRADLFGGDENNRVHARQFIGLLRRWAISLGPTVLLLDHPSMSGMATGSGSSGSTAWSNSVRSRLYFSRIRDDKGGEDDEDARVLTTKKANYARAGLKIALWWRRGVFVPSASAGTSFAAIAAQAHVDRVFLDLLDIYTAEGRPVSGLTSPTYAPAVFSKDPRAEGAKRKSLEGAMNRLFAARKIHLVETGPPSKRRSHIEATSRTDEGAQK
jgi:RecA-family ATPase